MAGRAQIFCHTNLIGGVLFSPVDIIGCIVENTIDKMKNIFQKSSFKDVKPTIPILSQFRGFVDGIVIYKKAPKNEIVKLQKIKGVVSNFIDKMTLPD